MEINAKASSSVIGGDDNQITRCCLINCAINNSRVKRCTLTNCVLSNVRDASRITAMESQFYDAGLIKYCEIMESTIQSQSSADRSTLNKTVVQNKSTLKRSTLSETTVLQSHLRKATLIDCDVTECSITKSVFTGMVLKYGIWKGGVLVGKKGGREPVIIRKDGSGAGPSGAFPVESTVAGLDSYPHAQPVGCPPYGHSDSDVSFDSGDDSDSDLPPPYEA